jgi:hypothetical protein
MRGNERESALGAWGATDSRSGRRDSLHPPQGKVCAGARPGRNAGSASRWIPEQVLWSAGLVRNTTFTRAKGGAGREFGPRDYGP